MIEEVTFYPIKANDKIHWYDCLLDRGWRITRRPFQNQMNPARPDDWDVLPYAWELATVMLLPLNWEVVPC